MAGAFLPLRQLFHHIGSCGCFRRCHNLRHMVIETVDRAIHLYQPHGGLFSDARYSGNVVRGVPHQGFQINHVDGCKAVLLPEGLLRHVPGGGLPHTGGHQLYLCMVRNKLQTVLISGDYDALPPIRLTSAGDGAD